MALKLYFRPSFKRSLKTLGKQQKIVVALILESLYVYYANNCDLQKAKELSAGFFYKQLRKPYYEAGIEKNIRVVIRKEGQMCIAVLAGNHDRIKRFLLEY